MQREKNDLQSRMEEDQEDMNELMKKHKAAVAQVTLSGTHACQIAIQSLSVIIAHRVDVCVYIYEACFTLHMLHEAIFHRLQHSHQAECNHIAKVV